MDFDTSTLKAIAYAMENQNESSVLCKVDQRVYSLSEVEELSIDMSACVQIPKWTSAQGYRLMCTFATSRNPEERRKLESVLNGKGHTFRRFREVVAELSIQDEWHSFKDERMFSVIRHWLSSSSGEDMADPDELDETALLLLDHDVVFEPDLSTATLSWYESTFEGKPFEKYVASYFGNPHACSIYKEGVLEACTVYAEDPEDPTGRTVVILASNPPFGTEAEGIGRLLKQVFDREMSRRKVSFVVEMNINAVKKNYNPCVGNDINTDLDTIYVL